jgi:hypothetical protein
MLNMAGIVAALPNFLVAKVLLGNAMARYGFADQGRKWKKFD